MDNCCTIIMYHYVRDIKESRYPELKGMEIDNFWRQVQFLKENYNIVRMEEVVSAIGGKTKLPPKAALLSFDDAYVDHYTNVFPILDDLQIQGAFYPSVEAIKYDRVLSVNKIHFLLTVEPDKQIIINDIFDLLNQYRQEFGLQTNEYYYQKLAKPEFYDPADVIFIKRLLQRELDITLREKIVHMLFEKHVCVSEKVLSRELYMSVEQLRVMSRYGMHIGGHGYAHCWLSSLAGVELEAEICKTVDFLEEINGATDNWTMCYPYGDFDERVIALLRASGCELAFTTVSGVAELTSLNRYQLPRIDTNEVPLIERT